LADELVLADKVLDSCGRLVAPPGYKYVDLPAFIPVRATFSAASSTPFQIRVKNNYQTQFICRGIIVQSNRPVRIKWPDGRYLEQGPSIGGASGVAGNPLGTGGNMLALTAAEKEIESGANITIEVGPP
jgi:hypothetical protein